MLFVLCVGEMCVKCCFWSTCIALSVFCVVKDLIHLVRVTLSVNAGDAR